MKNHYLPEIVVVNDVVNETEDITTIRIEHSMDPWPGQFIEVSVLGIGEAPFGICSYSQNYIEFSVRAVGNLSKILQRTKKGDRIGIRGPYGNGFPMKDLYNNDLIIIGGGTGISPLRSAIQFIEKNQEKYREVHLFFGYRSPSEFLYKEDMESWKKKFKFNLTIDKPSPGWQGNVGFLNGLVEKSGLNNKGKVVLICGPPVMIKVCAEALQKIGFNDDQIFVSLERLMQCGIGKCGHCMVNDKYVCKDGPVFRYDLAKGLKE